MRLEGFACKGCSRCQPRVVMSGAVCPSPVVTSAASADASSAASATASSAATSAASPDASTANLGAGTAATGLSNPVVALLGNPNTGKSSLFNALTGLRQHTGNWPGKTVAVARGRYRYQGREYTVVDLPGTYSLEPVSPEESDGVEFILGKRGITPDVLVLVADATALERSLALVLEALSIAEPYRLVVCLNLMDEARRKGIVIDHTALGEELGVPVIPTVARRGEGISALRQAVALAASPAACRAHGKPALGSAALADVRGLGEGGPSREEIFRRAEVLAARVVLRVDGSLGRGMDERVAGRGDRRTAVARRGLSGRPWDDLLDDIMTSPWTGYPIMLLLLGLVFWVTVIGANYPSEVLAGAFGWGEEWLNWLAVGVGLPDGVRGFLVDGVYRTTAWVVSVMLPPMAIFFPLFALFEDMGYLPRVAFNLDRFFRAAAASGKQALTMAMGFGCNAAGVTACRIIESPRERMLAVLTNCFVPCNGRYPALIALSMVFLGGGVGAVAAAWMAGIVVLGVACTLGISWLLSRSVLRGLPSFFAMEIPPIRPPRVGVVIVHSALDRTLHVLWRAVTVAAPAGGLVWLLANTGVGDGTALGRFVSFLDPVGRLMGLDGHILAAFILGLPANEIVLPLAVMGYTQGRGLAEVGGVESLAAVLGAHGWTWVTALCFMAFSVLHFPCATTLYTIWKETARVRWVVLGFVIPFLVAASVTGALAHLAPLLAGLARVARGA